jgi:hypothetical protein
MKIVRSTFLIGLAGYLAVTASVAQATYLDALDTLAGANRISYWGLEETTGTTAADSWGTNNGTYSDIGGGTTIGAAGPRPSDGFLGFSASNNAVAFSGTTSQLLQMADSASYAGIKSLTMVMWFNNNTGTDQRFYGGLYDRTVGASDRYGFAFNSNANIRGFVTLQDGVTELRNNSGTGGVTPNFRDSTWHMLTLTMQDNGANKEFNIFVDSTLKFTGSVTGGADKGLATRQTSGATTGTLAFGNDLGDTARSFKGRMDEIAFIGRSLSGAEVTTLYQAAVVPEPSSIVAALLGTIGLAVGGRRLRARS